MRICGYSPSIHQSVHPSVCSEVWAQQFYLKVAGLWCFPTPPGKPEGSTKPGPIWFFFWKVYPEFWVTFGHVIKDFEVEVQLSKLWRVCTNQLWSKKSRRVLFLTHITIRTVMAMRITMVDLTHFFCLTLWQYFSCRWVAELQTCC